jgi:hypothetical protein
MSGEVNFLRPLDVLFLSRLIPAGRRHRGRSAFFQFLGAQGRPLPTDADAPGSSTSITIAPGVVGHLDLHWTVVGGTPFVPVSLIFTMPADDGTNAAPWTGGPVNGAGRIDVGPLHA